MLQGDRATAGAGLPVDVRFDLPRQDNGAGLFRDVKDGLADFGGGGHIGRMFEIPHDSTKGAGFRSAGLFLLARRNRSGGRRGRRTIQRLQAFLGVAGAILYRIASDDPGISLSSPIREINNGAAPPDFVHTTGMAHQVDFVLISAADHVQRFVGIAVERITISYRF